MRTGLTTLALLAVVTTNAAAAPRNADPDWPCQQAKVSELSVASTWSGPAVDPAAINWQENRAVASLVGLITQRRLPLDQAGERIAEFARAAGTDKNPALLAVFAGAFEVLNGERTRVLNGLDRFGQRQKELAENLRRDSQELARRTGSHPARCGEAGGSDPAAGMGFRCLRVTAPVPALCLRRGDDDRTAPVRSGKSHPAANGLTPDASTVDPLPTRLHNSLRPGSGPTQDHGEIGTPCSSTMGTP